MYVGNIDLTDRGRYSVNYPPPDLAGLGIFGSKKKKRRRAAAKAEREAAALRIANLEKLMLARQAPTIQPQPAALTAPAPVAAPMAPAPVVNIQAPAPPAGMPKWAIPAAIGGALLLVAAVILPQIKRAR